MFTSSKFQRSKDKRKGNIWQLFRATDFESLMYPCFTICRILGLFPYKINALNIKICKTCYVSSTIITCVSCVCTLYAFYVYNFSKDYTNLPIARKLKDNCLFISGGFSAVATFILSKPRMHLIQSILELSPRLPLESYQNLSRLIHAKDIIFLIATSVEASMIMYKVPLGIIGTISVLYNWLVVFQMDMLYMNCVFVLKVYFKQINDNLMNLVEPVTNGEPHVVRGTYYNERNPFVLMELKALKKQHLAISNTVQVLNTIFSLQLLVTVIRTFSEVTFMLYFVVMRWKVGTTLKNVNIKIYDSFMIWVMARIALKLGLLVWACETGKNQAADINTTIHSVLNSISDKQMKLELQLFALQLVHHKNVFSAKWFNMDVTLLTAMVGGIITHFIILIQFLFISCYG